jgi:hypothetical protein
MFYYNKQSAAMTITIKINGTTARFDNIQEAAEHVGFFGVYCGEGVLKLSNGKVWLIEEGYKPFLVGFYN